MTGTEERDTASGRPRRDLKSLLAEYGGTALAVYLAIFAAVLVSFWFAIRLGWRPESAAGQAGTMAAAYVATKITQPLRIVATVVLTPVVAKLYGRFRGPGARRSPP
ncbi:MAG TPA: DUF1279 domain-containing protein [Gemmatimonadaceae bacterium]